MKATNHTEITREQVLAFIATQESATIREVTEALVEGEHTTKSGAYRYVRTLVKSAEDEALVSEVESEQSAKSYAVVAQGASVDEASDEEVQKVLSESPSEVQALEDAQTQRAEAAGATTAKGYWKSARPICSGSDVLISTTPVEDFGPNPEAQYFACLHCTSIRRGYLKKDGSLYYSRHNVVTRGQFPKDPYWIHDGAKYVKVDPESSRRSLGVELKYAEDRKPVAKMTKLEMTAELVARQAEFDASAKKAELAEALEAARS